MFGVCDLVGGDSLHCGASMHDYDVVTYLVGPKNLTRFEKVLEV